MGGPSQIFEQNVTLRYSGSLSSGQHEHFKLSEPCASTSVKWQISVYYNLVCESTLDVWCIPLSVPVHSQCCDSQSSLPPTSTAASESRTWLCILRKTQREEAVWICPNSSYLSSSFFWLTNTEKNNTDSTKFLKLSEVANPVGVDETTFLSGLSHKNKLLAMSATHGLYNYSVNLPGRSCMALSWTLLSVIYIFCSWKLQNKTKMRFKDKSILLAASVCIIGKNE